MVATIYSKKVHSNKTNKDYLVYRGVTLNDDGKRAYFNVNIPEETKKAILISGVNFPFNLKDFETLGFFARDKAYTNKDGQFVSPIKFVLMCFNKDNLTEESALEEIKVEDLF